MIFLPIVPRILLKERIIHRTFKFFKSLKGYKLMSGNKESLLPEEPKQSVEIKTLACDISLKVIGSGARGAPASVCLYSNESRYIFNCGESTQRINNEHRNKLCKLSKIGNVFITTPNWKNLGGLPGFLLCLQSYGVSTVNIHGPIGTIDICDVTRRFVYLKRLTVIEANINRPFVDNVLTVNYVLLEPQNADHNTEITETDNVDENVNHKTEIDDNIDYYEHEVNVSAKRKLSMYGDNVKRIKRQSDSIAGHVRSSMCYIGKIHHRIGKLNLNKCVEKGITPGPLLGQLKNGMDVTLENGTIIKSSDVVDPAEPGPAFIVVDCPREELLESLIQNPIFANYQSGTAKSKDMIASCIVHFTPESIIKDARYQKWMENFGWSTQHMIVNESNTCLGTEAIHKFQHQLHLLHDRIFPFWDESNIPTEVSATSQKSGIFQNHSVTEDDKESSVEASDESALVTRAKTLHCYSLVPKKGLNPLKELKLNPQEYLDEVFQMTGYLDALAEVQTNVSFMQRKLGEIPEYPKLVILGTSSTANNKMRNTSGILLRIDKDTSIVLDCGEGTIHQIFRIYGKETDNILSSIKAIYISHLHADHQLGLIGILQERSRSNQEPVYLLAPERIRSWLYFFDLRYQNISQLYTLIPLSKLLMSEHQIPLETEKRIYESLNVKEISTVNVDHCAFSYGVSFTLANDKKIVYSGDTMPCQKLVDLGKNCDLLIHEATFNDKEHAKEKLHSTVSQAINIGEKMKANFTLLTHFSQRFSKTFYMPEIGQRADHSKIGMAFDNMHIRLAELPILPLFYPCLKIMCYEETEVKEVNGKKVLGLLKSPMKRKIGKIEARKSDVL
ncbi:ribonuclease Z, mitochondrial isoform X3 [Leptopilina heterotoma]|nr:ribonuclease Z, mitochondrial isoform X3 [Leptopilina heterotoma]